MLKNKLIASALGVAFLVSVRSACAQDVPASGLYEIISGTYIECCGFAGDYQLDLPSERQRFVKLTIGPRRDVAAMTFLGNDGQTVSSVLPCPPGDPIRFGFDSGLVLSNSIVFHVDPGGRPDQIYWDYEARASADTLRINGTLRAPQHSCVDVPDRFSHSNVVAVLVPPPTLSITGVSKSGVKLLIQGHTGQTNVIEASADLVTWQGVSTNVMDSRLCPICPFAIFEDSASTNFTRRFYRAFEIP